MWGSGAFFLPPQGVYYPDPNLTIPQPRHTTMRTVRVIFVPLALKSSASVPLPASVPTSPKPRVRRPYNPGPTENQYHSTLICTD
ncbi:hypothetical protein J6590_079282 [Homalodisca vitripennis]|nr:hypothetical protein J6590_079282 [Homalodisca vitripennis]